MPIGLDNIDSYLKILFWDYSTSDNQDVIGKIYKIIENYNKLYSRHTRMNNLQPVYIAIINSEYNDLYDNYEVPETHHGSLEDYKKHIWNKTVI
jgi:hypothetical protein